MPISCSAYACTNRYAKNKGEKLTFHRFPLNKPHLLKQWIVAVRRKSWKPTQSSFLCSNHFSKECYKTSERHFLKDDAVPSIFNFPERLQTASGKRCRITKFPLPIKTKLDTKGENTTVNADDVENIKIADVRSVEKVWISSKPTFLIPGGMICQSPIPVGNMVVPQILTATVPLVVTAKPEVPRPNETIQTVADVLWKSNQNLPTMSKASPTVSTRLMPDVIKTEPIDETEEITKPVETQEEKRRQENTEDGPAPPPAKRSKDENEEQSLTHSLGTLPQNFQTAVLERLDALNKNLETNTCAMSVLSKDMAESSEVHVRAINHLANIVSDVGSLIYSSIKSQQKKQ